MSENQPLTDDFKTVPVSDWSDLGQQLWSYLTGRGAAVNYSFMDMTVEVPRDIGPDAPRATWKFNGTMRVTTSDNASTPDSPSSP
ncbi:MULTISPECIES: hypothetical protein [Arthrobacter]|uniref:Uncharacterized protein n=1 Tax=Arthrobacter psychrochitiniphilus TaxID=291045 RepID=A0A2V3DPK2_9MICC|nr:MULTISPECIES: hypothetical protein [Arthrobacter]NYG17496.1 hypothetical protein [Arthrobacter psychrochitiniphilus]PXA64611.1 hypothetical protein CVS29_13695 [Arthrobacter psychrochitiniphilus]